MLRKCWSVPKPGLRIISRSARAATARAASSARLLRPSSVAVAQLGYRCPSACRHCLYNAGPHRRDGAPESVTALSELLDELARRAGRARYHIGGGEPFLDLDLLEAAVGGLSLLTTRASPKTSEEGRSEGAEIEAEVGATTTAYSCRTVRRSDTPQPTTSAPAVGRPRLFRG